MNAENPPNDPVQPTGTVRAIERPKCSSKATATSLPLGHDAFSGSHRVFSMANAQRSLLSRLRNRRADILDCLARRF